jgi:molecular chaperone HtpG
MSQLEQKNEKLRFTRIDSDILENLIRKEDSKKDEYTDEQKEGLRKAFEAVLPQDKKLNYYISFEAAAEDALPVFLTQNEFMRRMKEMSAHQQGMSFYGQIPDSYNLVLNTNHPAIQALVEHTDGQEEQMKQLIDIALLAAGQLKGEALAKFVNRSVEMLNH